MNLIIVNYAHKVYYVNYIDYSPGFTLPFTPPEYFSSRDFTNKYDIYSYGVIMLQLIFSILPFEKHYSIIDVLKNKQSKERVLYIPENCQ